MKYEIRCEGTESIQTKGACSAVLGTLVLPDGVDPKKALTGYLCEDCGAAWRAAKARAPKPENKVDLKIRMAVEAALKKRGL